eukprot:CAMPEP_0117438390 /NCGR_PEP_ID=MMETSP0759-20121206/2028_1 /TAXON_ID=63605 /ORGANISM="Percolomonas cosmopolitus, Strain WS" /LENGTH=219 /DNA_ID=CAMNT_0005230079 /DNA_START=195 /DNA_END=854 /DNA_ORIENTATION=-
MHSFLNSNNTLQLSLSELKKSVKIPESDGMPEISKNEWIALHVIQFYNDVNMIYGCLDGACDSLSCPTMNAGSKYQFLWNDELSKHSEPEDVSARTYVQKTLDFISDLVNDESIFVIEGEFPPKFKKIAKIIFKKLLRIHLHITLTHWKDISSLGMEAHVNAALKHFILFGLEFRTLKKADLVPLNDWILKQLGPEYEKKLQIKKDKKDKKEKRERRSK